ncbi:acetylxylan esterase [Pontiellaceae bacterium B12227]|nr:acetylxylan esterase [Pontiellaceae bacterium B12227]
MKIYKGIRFVLLMVLLACLRTQAATFHWSGGAVSNDWNNVASWSTSYLPGSTAADTVLFIGTGDSTTLITPFVFTNASHINLRSNGGPTVTLAADLSNVGNFYLAGNSGHDGGTVIHLDGTLTVDSLKVGAQAGATSESAYTISDGRIANSGNLYVNKGTFTLSGSTAEVGANSMTVTGIGELKFELGASGVIPISVTNEFSINATSELTIDASSYTATNTVIELLQYGSLSGSFDPSLITVTGLSAQQEPATIVYDGDSMNLVLAEPDPNWQAVMALGDLTNAPTVYTTNGIVTNITVGAIQSIMYDGQDYTGAPTRVWAYVGLPAGASSNNPVPAVVCVHGGGGTAYSDWVQQWNDRGYAAIAMDTEGRWVNQSTGEKEVQPWGGPQRTGVYDKMDEPITDHFMYHATADAILANSLMRSLPEVNADQVGIIGVSWGGVITSTTIGIDDRLAFAIPTYGCGHMFDALNHWGDALENNEMYRTVWDPVLRMENATMPVLWYSWPTDYHFPMDCQAYCYHGAPGEHMVSLVPGMGHGHGATWLRPESYDFADNIISNGTGWCVQQSISLIGSNVEVVFAATRTLKTATLIYTTETGKTGDLTWIETNATSLVESPAGIWTVAAQLPTNATGWFVNTTADANVSGYRGDGDVIASSDYQEVIHVALNGSQSFAMSHPLTETQSTGELQADFTAPTNVEIVDVATTNDSHAGALSFVGDYPVVLYTSGLLGLQFDNTVAGLTDGESATGTVLVVWENLDGSTDQASVPYEVTARAAQTVVYDVDADWSSESVYEIDDVFIVSNAVVGLDQQATAGSLTISNGTMLLDQDYQLTLGDNLSVEADGALLVNDGTVNLNSTGFAIDGVVTIDGGTVDVETLGLTGSGTLRLKSGALSFGGGSRMDLDLLEISGGTADFGSGHTRIAMSGSAEFRVVGTGASISMTVLNLQPHTADDPTLRFVLDETGVSIINVSSFMNLPQATIIADGTAYSGGATNLVLIDSGNLSTLGDPNKYSTTGFAEKGLIATVVQDQTNGKDWVELVLTETAYGSWIRGFGLSGADLSMSANPDGDAYTNEKEFIAGLNPSIFDAFEISNFTAGVSNSFEWTAVSGRLYNVFWASNLVDGFSLVESNAVNGRYIDSDSHEQGFYKITVELEP